MSRPCTKQDINQAWLKDRQKYPDRPWLKEISIIAIAWYRYGQKVDLLKEGFYKTFSLKVYWFVFHLIEIVIGISLPKSACIGSGLRIYHFGNIFIHRNAVLGNDCILRQGVTIGNRYNDDDVPTLGNNVELGAYSQILGKVSLGNNVKTGAMSVILIDVPDGKTICGIPGRIVN